MDHRVEVFKVHHWNSGDTEVSYTWDEHRGAIEYRLISEEGRVLKSDHIEILGIKDCFEEAVTLHHAYQEGMRRLRTGEEPRTLYYTFEEVKEHIWTTEDGWIFRWDENHYSYSVINPLGEYCGSGEVLIQNSYPHIMEEDLKWVESAIRRFKRD
jgi:hypothetical protein